MNEQLKAKLRELSAAKRKATVLLKDIEPHVLAIFAVDHFDEFNGVDDGRWGYLRWASEAQVSALRQYLPFKRIPAYSDGTGMTKWVIAFSVSRLTHALHELGVKWMKIHSYVRTVSKEGCEAFSTQTAATNQLPAGWAKD